jgi:hypothetical protein
VTFFKGRLRRVEANARKSPPGRCPECGLPADGTGRIVYTGEGAPGEGFQGDPDERCASCGRFLYTVIRVVYDGEEGGGDSYWPRAPA